MFRTSVKYFVLGIAVVAILAVCATNSEACWRCRASCYSCAPLSCSPCGYGYVGGYSVGYVSAYSYASVGCGDCYAGCYRPCAVRRACCSPCRVSCGCGCGYGVSYGVTYGAVSAGCGCNGGTVIQGQTVSPTQSAPAVKPTPAAPAPMQPTPAPAPAAAPKATSVTRPDAGMVSIWVPENAKVVVNGYETKSTGNLRQYISYGLQAGYTYNYEIVATVVVNGKTVKEARSVKLTAGERTSVAFSFAPKSNGMSLAAAW